MKIERLIVGSFEVCCYIVYCEDTKEGVIIDPGAEDPRILELIKTLDIKVKAILGTHGHPDHVVGVSFLKEALNVPFGLHEEDDRFFQDKNNFSFFRSWGFPENPKADLRLKEGDEIVFGKEKIKVIHTPGHSPGSICFYNPKEQVLFTGDTLFVEGVGRADLPGGNFFQMMESIKKKILTLPEETSIFPGHDYGSKPVSTIGEEKINNPFLEEIL
ncbi:MAG: hydroxyacylglutathione hydrolase [Thermodesulfobacterium sp.]|jgi:glyoxylase-like metal-dependent hydrolase (beta-lactamase superfamily II)|nr:hydroxyacylglutathione hydrolase [Thermodesulfobacterium sp.]